MCPSMVRPKPPEATERRKEERRVARVPYIPPRFEHELDRHLVFNLADVVPWPLVLGVFGRPGDGKSFQIRTHLERRKVLQVSINAADLESDRAGQPGKLVLAAYEDAGHRISEGAPAALIVDDFDTTVGEWAQSTTTVNHQQVLAQLMHLADTPTEAIGRTLRRVPVLVTGNDLSKVYPPMRRPGRMRPFPWLPTDAERHDVVAAILADTLPPAAVSDLLVKLPDAPIAFFSDLLVELFASAADAQVREHAQDLKALARDPGGGRDRLNEHLRRTRLSPSEISEIALAAWHDRMLATQSHLNGV
jgi:hypothetical protein